MSYVADAFILPKLSSAAIEARLEIVNQSKKPVDARLAVDVKPWKGTQNTSGGHELSVRLEPGANSITIPADVNHVQAWTPDDPFLYIAQVGIFEGVRQRDN